MNFLNKPNLPQSKVRAVLCDCRISEDIVKELNNLGIHILYVPEFSNLQSPVSAHPDMHVSHLGGGEFITSQEYCENFTIQVKGLNVDCDFFNNSKLKKNLSENYPYDVLLNCVMVGDYLICNRNTISAEIIEKTSKTIIHVKQGYTKCSTCVVSDGAIITDDISIKNATEKNLDVLYVDHGVVQLTGYQYGFIGGCSGKLSKDCIAFTGNLDSCIYHSDIKSFCKNHGVQCISLSKQPLYDYGSILPIIEE